MASAGGSPRGGDAVPPLGPMEAPWAPSVSPWLVAMAVVVPTFMEVLDTSVANVALPHMQTSLGATFDTVTWVLTSFIIASAVATPITGWLADRVGSRNLFLIAVSGFMITSMLCGIATSMPMLVVGRLLQGAGSGPMVALSLMEPDKPPQLM